MTIECVDFLYLIQVPVVIDVKNWLVVLKTRSEFDKFVNRRRHLNDLDYGNFQHIVMQGSNSGDSTLHSIQKSDITCPGAQFV